MLPVVYGENMFDDLFDNGFFGSHNPLFGKNARNLMKTDIRETDDAKAYRLAVELPGFKKDEISLDLRDGYLTISAEKMVTKIVCSLPFASSRISSFMLSPSFRSFL